MRRVNMEIRNNLQARRKELGLSRPQLAQVLGVSWETIKAYESRGALPSLPKALLLAKIFDCTVEDIFELHLDEYEEDSLDPRKFIL